MQQNLTDGNSMMIAERFLERLEGVRSTGQDKWIARCPVHGDKSPSLAVREVDDRVLIHCFAGCDVHEVVSAVGLKLSDLFLNKVPIDGHKPLSRPFPAPDILRCLSRESIFLIICATDTRKGKKLNDQDYDRLLISSSRIKAAITAGGLR